MFSGFTSRWITFASCAAARPRQTCSITLAIRASGSRLLLRQLLLERAPVEELHRDVGDAVVGDPGVEDLDDVGVAHAPAGHPLVAESLERRARVVAGLRAEDLHGDRAARSPRACRGRRSRILPYRCASRGGTCPASTFPGSASPSAAKMRSARRLISSSSQVLSRQLGVVRVEELHFAVELQVEDDELLPRFSVLRDLNERVDDPDADGRRHHPRQIARPEERREAKAPIAGVE